MTPWWLARVLVLCVVAVMLLAPLSNAAISRQHAKRRGDKTEASGKGPGSKADDRSAQADGDAEADDGDSIAKGNSDVSSSSAAMSRAKGATPLPPSPNEAAPTGVPTIQRLRDKVPSSVSVGTLPRIGAVLMHVLPEVPIASASATYDDAEEEGEADADTGKGDGSLDDPVRVYRPRHPYPWGSSLADRSSQLLAQMRAELRLTLDESLLPLALTRAEAESADGAASSSSASSGSSPLLVTPQLLAVSDSLGEPFGCALRRDLEAGHEDPARRPQPSSPSSSSSSTEGAEVPMHQLDSDLLSRQLSGLCSTLHLDYWTYEWCHRVAVSQYHITVGQRTSKKDPDWSLGKFTGASLEREGGQHSNLSAPIARLAERFEGGQRCDETNGHRSSEVGVVCCRGAEAEARLRPVALQRFQKFPPAAASPNSIKAMLVDVEEPSICSYRLTVCSDLLCRKAPDVSLSRPRRLKEALPGILDTLAKTCTIKQESWWAYEVCVGQGIRQYHEEPVSEVVDLSDEKGGELMQAAAAATATGARRSGKRGPDTAAHPGGSEGGGAGGSSSGAASGRAGTGTGAGGKPSPEASELRGVREKEKERQLSGSQGATDKSSAKKVVSLTMKVLSEFSLGLTPFKLDTSTSADSAAGATNFRDAVAVVRRQEGIAVGLRGERLDHGVSALRMEFRGGTACDLRNTSRASTVELFCGLPWGYRNFEIAEVIEDSTCHYLIKVSVPSLCQVEGFTPKPKKTIDVDCISLHSATVTVVEPPFDTLDQDEDEAAAAADAVDETAPSAAGEVEVWEDVENREEEEREEDQGADAAEEAVDQPEALQEVTIDSHTGESQDSGSPKSDAEAPRKPPSDSSAPGMDMLERARDRIRRDREARRQEAVHLQEQGNGAM